VPDTTAPRPPLLVVLHDVDQDETSLLAKTTLVERCRSRGWIVLSPLGRGNAGYVAMGERDVLDAIEAVRGSLPVDGRRIYVLGLGMGGTGAWLLPLRHPDLFAAASIVAGYGDFSQPGLFEIQGFKPGEEAWYEAHDPVRLVRRDMTTAFRIVHGERDAVVSPVHARVLHAKLDELGVKHEFRLDPAGDHSLRFFEAELAASLDFLERQARRADGQWNRGVFAVAGPPVTDVFARGPFAIVWGSASAPRPQDGGAGAAGSADAPLEALPDDLATARQLAAQWSARFHGAARVLPDTSVTPELLRTTNLVLVGDPSTNALLARWASRLPVRTEPGIFTVGTSGYPLAKYGIVYAAASPEYPDRSLVVVSGMRDRLGSLPRSAFGVAAAYAVVSRTEGMIRAGDLVE
jgi:pimeloyl-ACP methyl ester carboxylesterase